MIQKRKTPIIHQLIVFSLIYIIGISLLYWFGHQYNKLDIVIYFIGIGMVIYLITTIWVVIEHRKELFSKDKN